MTSAATRQAPAVLDTSDQERKVPLRRIVALFRPHTWLLALLLVLVVGQAAFNVVAPFMLRAIIDRGLPERNAVLITWLALGMIGSAVAAGALGVVTGQLSNVIGQRIMHGLRVSVYGHLQRMSLAFFTRTRTGDVLSRVLNDVGGVDNVVTNTASSLVQNTVTAGAIVVAMLLLDWRLSVLALLVVPLFLAMTFRLGRQRRALSRRRQGGLSALTTLVEESLSVAGVLLAKTMGLRDELVRRFSDQSKQISDVELAAVMAGRWRLATRRVALVVVPAIVYWLAGIEVAHGASLASIGTVVAFSSMVNRLIGPISGVQGIGQNVSVSMALFGRIFDVLDLPVDVDDRPGARPLVVTRGEVRLTDVSFRYEGAERWTIEDLDLVCPPGSMTAIVGETGSGKTTLAYLIARLYEPERGTVSVDGTDVRDVTLGSLATSIGLVSQETYLLHASIRENLLLAKPDATDEQLRAATGAARLHDLIEGLPDGYDTMVGERGYRFSGGERQRLAIARMLLRNPPVLLLDEATSALDTRTERAVQEALDALSEGRTTIVIAHRLATIERADQIVVLHDGRIVERGTHADLVGLAGRYAGFLRPAGPRSGEQLTAG
ncbi:ABC transporter ATP-binding protein [Rugosimonospora acidiphila]|uniref:ABC transporter ATP-binding protein n=1 Tax=Rugosimonospora acidiphila TaxID=556531 RepID=A0ABP9RWX0_9ACTN